MNFLPLAFGSPLILAGLIALPVIWWLLRMTPPRPQEETFPPLRILAQVFRREEVPSKSPWWMTLLRLLIAGLVILALASPIWNPRPLALPGNEPLAIVIDNGWASAEDWRQRVNAAEKLISDAQGANAQIYVIGTAEPANAEIGPYDGRRATERLQALEPRPIPVDRKTAMERLASALPQDMKIRLAFLSDGLASPADDKTFATFDKTGHLASVLWYDADLGRTLALTGIDNKADSLEATAVRPDGITTPRQL
ncbi:BatA domain-containing protein, partial [Brucella melitensis]